MNIPGVLDILFPVPSIIYNQGLSGIENFFSGFNTQVITPLGSALQNEEDFMKNNVTNVTTSAKDISESAKNISEALNKAMTGGAITATATELVLLGITGYAAYKVISSGTFKRLLS